RHRRAAYPQGALRRSAQQAARGDVGARDPGGAEPLEAASGGFVGYGKPEHCRATALRTPGGGGPQQPLEKSASALARQRPPRNDHAAPVRCTVGRARQPVDDTAARHDTLSVHENQPIGSLAAERALYIHALLCLVSL